MRLRRSVLARLVGIAAVVGAAGGACAQADEPTPTSPPAESTGQEVEQGQTLAYVDLGGTVNLVTENGEPLFRLAPPEGMYVWPTWSPDGAKLAISQLVEGEGRNVDGSLHVFRTATGRMERILPTSPALGAWSPRGRRTICTGRRTVSTSPLSPARAAV